MNTVAYVLLMLLLALTIGLSYVPMGAWAPLASQGIAALKAALVAAFFMDLEKSTPLVRLLGLGALLWLGLMFGLTMSDYFTRL